MDLDEDFWTFSFLPLYSNYSIASTCLQGGSCLSKDSSYQCSPVSVKLSDDPHNAFRESE